MNMRAGSNKKSMAVQSIVILIVFIILLAVLILFMLNFKGPSSSAINNSTKWEVLKW